MYSFSKMIGARYEIKTQLGASAFGEQYEVIDIDDKNKIKRLYVFSTSLSGSHAINFQKYCESTLEFNHIVRKSASSILSPDNIKRLEDKSKQYILLDFSPQPIFEPIGTKYNWDEANFRFNTPPDETVAFNLLKKIVEKVLTYHIAGLTHSYISPDTCYFVDNEIALLLPYFYLLLFEDKGGNIKSISENNPDLQVFPLAPEIILDQKKITTKSDVWSLGILLSLFVTNKKPFHFNDEKDYINAVKTSNLHLFLEEVPLKYREIISKSLVLDPEFRISSQEFYDRLLEIGNKLNENPNHSFFLTREWIESTYPQSTIRLEFSDSEFKYPLIIYPDRIPPKAKDEGISAKVVFRLLELAGVGNEVEIPINLFPAPVIEVLESGSSLSKRKDNFFEGRLSFKIRKSSVCISEIKITLILSDGTIINCKNIQYIQLNQLISESAYHQAETIGFDVGEDLKIGDPLTVDVTFYIRNHTPLKSTITILPEHPALLSPDFDLTYGLITYMGCINYIPVPFRNIGGRNVLINDISINGLNHHITLLNGSEIKSKQIPPERTVELRLVCNARDVERVEGKSGIIVINYTEFIGSTTINRNREYKFQWQILSLNRLRKLSIDFGTSNTCAAIEENDGRISVIEWSDLADDLEDSKSIPSFIYYSDKLGGEALIGKGAKDAYNGLKRNSFHSIKRFIAQGREELVYLGGMYTRKSYEEMTIDYLSKLKNHLQNSQGINFDKYIFTHPTGFDENKKLKFEEIVKSSGLCSDADDVEFVDEATAGALNYIRDFKLGDHYFLVFDCGGGTTDVVMAKFSHIETETIVGNINHKTISPIFSAGYDLGGDDINYSIIQGLREYFFRKLLIIPYVHPDRYNMIPAHFLGNPTVLDVLRGNAILLWKFAEEFKKKILNPSDDLISESDLASQIRELDTVKGTTLNDPAAWDFSKREKLIQHPDATMYDFIKKSVFYDIGQKFDQVVSKLLKDAHEIVKDKHGLTILLLGRSSRFALISTIFNHYLKGSSFNETEYPGLILGQNTLKFNDKSLVRIPDEMKHVISKGALEVIREENKITIDKNHLNYSVYAAGNMLIPAGGKKVSSESEVLAILADGDQDEYAIYINDTSINDTDITIYQQTTNNRKRIGNLLIHPNSGFIGVSARFVLFVDKNDRIKWIFESKGEVLTYGMVQ